MRKKINSSYSAGKEGEDKIHKILNKYKYRFYRCSNKNHSGDFILYLDKYKICIDVKNHYISNRTKNNLIKLKSDTSSKKCDFGIIIFTNAKNILKIYVNNIEMSIDKLIFFLNNFKKKN